MEVKHINFIDTKIKKGVFSEHNDPNINGFKMYMTSCFIAPPRSGKTTSAIQLCKYLQDNKLVTDIYLLSPTIESNIKAFKDLNIPEENMFDDLERSNEILTNIESISKIQVEEWKKTRKTMTEKEYNKQYKYIYNIYKSQLKNYKERKSINYDDEDDDEYTLDDEDFQMLEDNKYEPEPFYYQYGNSTLIICDDILGSNIVSKKTNNKLNKLICNHRHNHINIFILSQYYKAIPKTVRSNIKQFFLWKIQDISTMKTFYDEIANNFFNDFDEFKEIFQHITNEPHNFLLIDQDPKNDKLKLRSGFNGIINI